MFFYFGAEVHRGISAHGSKFWMRLVYKACAGEMTRALDGRMAYGPAATRLRTSTGLSARGYWCSLDGCIGWVIIKLFSNKQVSENISSFLSRFLWVFCVWSACLVEAGRAGNSFSFSEENNNNNNNNNNKKWSKMKVWGRVL